MSSAEMSSRKRKACLQCIRAKAKCSPSDEKPDECHRCLRLNKQCVFEVVAKKPGPGPKSRSRVRQLEQRVESLIDLIAAQKAAGGTTDARILEQAQSSMQAITPDSTSVPDSSPADSPASGPAAKYHIASAPFKPYDPVDAGIIEEQYAYRLVEDFKKTFVHSFPFVVLDTDAATLRQNQPFLFHAILTATAYESPATQLLLGGEFKVQIARIIEHSRKSLEILQGLLVYAAWYHAFYQPVSQQIAIIVQLCVALVQDLGLSKHSKPAPQKWSVADCTVIGRPKGTLAEKRAYAGTFYLSVAFAQAWRKTTTLRHSRYMAQCAEIFASSTVPTDALIKPMLQASELLMRVNDSFSYDDIDNSEIHGELLLDMCATNFLAELKRIRDAANMIPSVRQNPTLTLMLYLVELTINEICVHSVLWGSEGQMTAATPPLIRLKMLNRVMETATAYIDVLMRMPQTSLFRLGLGTWAAWFYVVIIMCRIVFLTENERLGQSDLDNIPEELDNLIPENIEQVIARSAATGYQDRPAEAIWDAVTIAREYKVQALFEGFMEKLRFTLPVGVVPWSLPHDQRDALHSIGSIQQTMLYGFKKRLNRLASGSALSRNDTQVPAQVDNNASAPLGQSGDSSTWRNAYLASTNTYATGNPVLPFSGFMNFDAINFDGVNIPGNMYTPQVGQEVLGDFMWNMVMDDFRMPGL